MDIDWTRICEDLKGKLDNVFTYFHLTFDDKYSYYSGCCPCHNSDNQKSCVIYKNSGIWTCFTQHCEEKYGKSLKGFIKGVIDNSGQYLNNYELYEFLTENFQLNGNYNYVDRNQDFVRYVNIGQNNGKFEVICQRERILDRLEIPSSYFLKRGLSPEILTKFDVGDCYNENCKMYKRAVCPVYDVDGNSLIGYTGRSIVDEIPKWLHSENLPCNQYFYGIWESKQAVELTKTAIIVEGMGDVLRCHEIGFLNAVGCFSNKLSNLQLLLLNDLGVENLVILMDGDVPGQEAAKRIQLKCKYYFNIENVVLDGGKDPLDLEKETLMEKLSKYAKI